jgi:hypothetical protein
MKRIYITFSGQRYHNPTSLAVQNAPKFGAEQVTVYDDHWLSTACPEFMAKANPLFTHPKTRGYGWFSWKPFVIMDALFRNPDAVVLFVDGDTHPIHDLSVIYDTAERERIMLFSAVGCWQRRWCKRDCYILMGQDEPKYYDQQHAVARFMAFTKDHIPFLAEWQHYVLDIRCNTFDPSVLAPEVEGFHEHRCEQAMLTNLAHKYGHRLYREACQFGESVDTDRDLFPQLFVQIGDYSYPQNRSLPGSAFRNIEGPTAIPKELMFGRLP